MQYENLAIAIWQLCLSTLYSFFQVGEYTGVIPDADGLCARSYTDCNNPEVMFYTVYSCNNQTEVSFFGTIMGREI